MRMVAADQATVEAGRTYLLWFMPALALQFASRVMGAALSGTGIVRPSMVVQALAVIVNIALAPVLISGWGTGHALGVAGAGLASSIAVAIGVMMMWIYFRRLERYVGFDPAQIRPQLRHWKRILDVGLPAGGEFAIIFVWMGVIYYVLRDFGAAAQAGFGIGTRVLGLIQMPALAIAIAAGTDRRAEFRRRQRRAREGNLHQGGDDQHGGDDRLHDPCAMASPDCCSAASPTTVRRWRSPSCSCRWSR